MVLQEHDWNVEDALQVLQMFSDPGANSSFLLSCFLLTLPSCVLNFYISILCFRG